MASSNQQAILGSSFAGVLPRNPKPDEMEGKAYESGLFVYLLTQKKLRDFDFGKEFKIADKFDDLIIRLGKEYICFQAKLVKNPQGDLIDSDVLLGRKQISLHRDDFNLRKYFISYLRMKDQFNSRNDNSRLKRLIIFTNAKPADRLVEPENESEIMLVPRQTDQNIGMTVPKINQDAKDYRIKEAVEVLKDHLTKYLKSDLKILSEEVSKHVFMLDENYLKYYYEALIKSGIIEQKNGEVQFTQEFIDDRYNLSTTAKMIRKKLMDFLQNNNYGKVDEQDLVERFKKAKIPVFDVEQLAKYEPDLESSDLLLEELAKYIIPPDKRMVLDREYFNYYHTALINENIIEIQEIQSGKKVTREGKFTQNFIDNDSTLSTAAKKLRDIMPQSISAHAQKLKTYLTEAMSITTNAKSEAKLKNIELLISDSADPQKLKKRLKNVRILASNDFGIEKKESTKIFLPNYDVTGSDVSDFLDLLEFRVNEHGVKKLFSQITNKEVKERFLSSYDIDPKMIVTLLKDSVDAWKNSGGSTTEGWILNSERKNFIQNLESDISKSKASHKTREYTQDLSNKIEEFDIHFNDNYAFKETSFPSTKKVFVVKTSSTLLTSIKMLAYLEETKREDYIFINVGSLMIKEEIKELIRRFRVDEFMLLILSYDSSLGDKLKQELANDICEIIQSGHEKIVLITSVDDDFLIETFKNNQDQCEQISDEGIALEHLINPSRILEHEVIFQGRRTALKTLINQDNDTITTVSAKTLDKIVRNEDIKIGSQPFGTSDLTGAYAQLSEEVNKETLTSYLFNNAPEFLYVISGLPLRNGEHAKKIFIENLQIPQNTVVEKKINSMISILIQPYSVSSTNKTIQLVDNDFEDKNFKEFCGLYFDKKIFWIKSDESKFLLKQIYSPDFYIKRKFNKTVIKKSISAKLRSSEAHGTVDQFVFNGIHDYNALASFLQIKTSELEQKRIFIASDAVIAQNKFNELNDTVHWLELKSNGDCEEIIWRNSKGSVKNLRDYIEEDNRGSLGEESELLQFLEDKQAVIIADDPGMGKSTTLVKLYESEGLSNGLLATHWIINLNLKDNLKAVRGIGSKAINSDVIKEFLSEVGPHLKSSFSLNLLAVALDKKKSFSKSLLIVFDGFDEVLDEDDRAKIISLLVALRNDTNAKFYVSTRMQYKKALENVLSTFSVTFKPLDNEEQKIFIERFFRTRLRLLIAEDEFKKIFNDSDGIGIAPIMHAYADRFLEKMQQIFRSNILSFIGTPLQLDLLLGSKGSIESFKDWVDFNPHVPNFLYIGTNISEVYENFIAGKYEAYSKRIRISEKSKQEYDFKQWISNCKYLAKSLFIRKNLNLLLEPKSVVLAPGLIKSDGNNLEFIHTTFGEYFAAEVLMHWIEKGCDLTNTKKQEMLLKSFLISENYRVIRSFINARLANRLETLPDKTFKEYGNIIGEELERKIFKFHNKFSETPLHIAAKEGNANIAGFLVRSIEDNREWLKKLLRVKNDRGCTTLHVAAECGSSQIVNILLNPFTNDLEFLKEFIQISRNVLSSAYCCPSIKQGVTALHVAATSGFDHIVESLLKPFTNDVQFLKALIRALCHESFTDYSWVAFYDHEPLGIFTRFDADWGLTALHLACMLGREKVIEKLTAPFVDDIEFLENLIATPTIVRNSTALHFLCYCSVSVKTVEKLLTPFTNDIREKLIRIQTNTGTTILHNAAALCRYEILKKLLSYFDSRCIEKLIEIKTKKGKTVFHLAVQNANDHVDIVELLLENVPNMKKMLTMEDNKKNTSLHIATLEGNYNIVNQLLTYAKNIDDNWETFKKLVQAGNSDGKNAFEMVSYNSEIRQIIKKFNHIATEEKAPAEIVNFLLGICIDPLFNKDKGSSVNYEIKEKKKEISRMFQNISFGSFRR